MGKLLGVIITAVRVRMARLDAFSAQLRRDLTLSRLCSHQQSRRATKRRQAEIRRSAFAR